MIETVLSFDPGGTTGWAKVTRIEGSEKWDFGTIVEDAHHYKLWSHMHKNAPDQIIYEEFQYQRRDIKKGVQLEIVSREYIGVIRLFSQQENVPAYESRLSALKFWDDKKLKQVGLYSPSIHSRDAARHLLWWLCFVKNDQTWIEALRPVSKEVKG